MATRPSFFSVRNESPEDAEARRGAERRARREEARRWYARLPYLVIVSLCSAVFLLVAGVTLLGRVWFQPAEPAAAASAPAAASVPRSASAPSAPASTARTVLRLDARLLFDFDSARLRADAAGILWDRLGRCLAAPILRGVRVVGHTDCIGHADYNLDLSLRRATALREWIVERTGRAIEVSAAGLVSCPANT